MIALADLEKLGEELLAEQPDVVEERIDATGPDALATLIYTSGTTGRPKGVRLRHKSWTYEGAAIQAQGILDETDLQFLWLPMAHSFGKVLLSTQLACGFADRRRRPGRQDHRQPRRRTPDVHGRRAADLREGATAGSSRCRPPRAGVKEKIFNQAFEVGLRGRRGSSARASRCRSCSPSSTRVFDKLVFTKIRERFGGRVRFFISGAAALNRDIAEWFHAAGIVILEGYGLTESSAGSFVNHPDDYRFGTRRPGRSRAARSRSPRTARS